MKMETKSIMEMLKEGNVRMCAPMVRCSKLAFRTLVRKYNCDVAFTPMIVSEAILNCDKAFKNEFVTNEEDRPLIVQFAAKNADELAESSKMVARHCDGVDLNCGCPQRWVMADGFGAHLMEHPDVVQDMVRQTRNRLPYAEEQFSISIKCRIYSDVKKTVNFCQQMERAGVSWITVHGRTKYERKEPVNLDTIRSVVDSVSCPVVANGDIKCISDCERVTQYTGAKGVMAARGLLTNPALFAGYQRTPVECVSEWLEITSGIQMNFTLFHQHLMYMCEKIMSKADRRIFNALTCKDDVINYLIQHYDINPQLSNTS